MVIYPKTYVCASLTEDEAAAVNEEESLLGKLGETEGGADQ